MAETDNDPSASTASFRAFVERSEDERDPATRRSTPVGRPSLVGRLLRGMSASRGRRGGDRAHRRQK